MRLQPRQFMAAASSAAASIVARGRHAARRKTATVVSLNCQIEREGGRADGGSIVFCGRSGSMLRQQEAWSCSLTNRRSKVNKHDTGAFGAMPLGIAVYAARPEINARSADMSLLSRYIDAAAAAAEQLNYRSYVTRSNLNCSSVLKID